MGFIHISNLDFSIVDAQNLVSYPFQFLAECHLICSDDFWSQAFPKNFLYSFHISKVPFMRIISAAYKNSRMIT